MCGDCPESDPFYWRSKNVKSRHYGKCHNDSSSTLRRVPREAIPVKVQTVFALNSHRKDFRVAPSLGPAGVKSSATLESDPEDKAFEGFLKFRKAVPRVDVMPGQQGLQETWPFIHFLNWDQLAKDAKFEDLNGLVQLPGAGDKLKDLVGFCELLFKEEQQGLEASAHRMLRQQINDPQDG